MIRVVLGEEVKPGMSAYVVEGYDLRGQSRQPLLDACRSLKSLGVDTKTAVGTFRGERTEPNLTCTVGAGAATTVSEPDKGIVKFVKYQPFDFSTVREKLEVEA